MSSRIVNDSVQMNSDKQPVSQLWLIGATCDKTYNLRLGKIEQYATDVQEVRNNRYWDTGEGGGVTRS